MRFSAKDRVYLAASIVLAVVIIIGVLVVGIASNKRSETLTIAFGDWGWPQPFAFYPRGPGYVVTSLLFDTLVWKDSEGIVPCLADSWEVLDNGSRYVFHLRHNVKWSDGVPLDSGDVAFTFLYMLQKGWRWRNVETGLISSIETPDAYTVVVRLSHPYVFFLENYASTVFIIPRHIWENTSSPSLRHDAGAFTGTGPYKLGEYKPGVEYRLTANKDYFLGEPVYDTLVLKAVNDPNIIAASLRKGDVQVASFWGKGYRIVGELEKSIDGLKIVKGHTYWALYIDFNMERWPENTTVFRWALAYAINLTDLVERTTGLEAGIPGVPGFLPPYSPWYNNEIPNFTYDPGKADDLLRFLGIYDRNGDGVRDYPDGKSVVLTLITIKDYEQEALIVKEYLGKIGLETRIKVFDSFALLDKASRQGGYDLMITGHGAVGNDPTAFSWYFSRWGAKPWENSTYNYLLSSLFKAKSIEDARKIVDELQLVVYQNLPQIPLYYPESFVVSRPEVKINWFYTYMGIDGGIPLPYNKLAFLGETNGKS